MNGVLSTFLSSGFYKMLALFVTLLVVESSCSVFIPTRCAHFAKTVNGKRELDNNASGDTQPEDDYLLERRFLLYNRLMNTTILSKLPKSVEISKSCRLDYDEAPERALHFLKAASGHYKLCLICDGLSEGNCKTIGLCPNGSRCFKGTNEVQLHHGDYHFNAHGCCNPHDTKCKSRGITVNHLVRYKIDVCAHSICNIGPSSKRESILNKIYKVDGSWSAWGHWSSCSVSCGKHGNQTRVRTCTNPAPEHSGKDCVGGSKETKSCMIPCPVNGGWSTWSSYSACSMSCCNGTKIKTRQCNHPVPAHGGRTCHGGSTYTRICTNSCKGDQHWEAWGVWSVCPHNCRDFNKTRTRTCTGQTNCTGPCLGNPKQTDQCNSHPCPVNGGWGRWSAYSACSVTCCTGSKTRTRLCDHPIPAYGGKTCPGSSNESLQCQNSCKGDSVWSHWGHWTACSKSCDGGEKTRTRTCKHQDNCTGPCPGAPLVKSGCSTTPCPVWSDWLYGQCSVTCGGNGTKLGMRRCSSGHEEDCPGKSTAILTCQTSACPVNGGWSSWSGWSKCSETCNQGTRTRNRTCTNPAPANSGTDCSGSNSVTEQCTVVECPYWGDYLETGPCSVTCGTGFIQLERKCSTGNRNDCTGSAFEEKKCVLHPC